jgi:beta-lactamase superfamily II metal-dependent hydrolase
MTTLPNSETPPSDTSQGKLTIDFFESGVGETIRITFPDGGIGIVDAHPSQTGKRPPIEQLVADRKIHFVCLTHPHADHGIDLIPILRDHPEIGTFWHTLSAIDVFVFAEGGQLPNYRSPIRQAVAEFQSKWARFLIQIYGYAGKRKLPHHQLRADLESTEIAGVRIHFLSPEEAEQNRFTSAYQEIARGERKSVPDPNALSAILALEYGGTVVLLGADGLKKNWETAIRKYRRLGLSEAAILKVPHHGAPNAFEFSKGKHSYLDLCSSDTIAVLFAGDVNHPEERVDERLRMKTKLACLANGLHAARFPSNPLAICLPGAIAVAQTVSPCQDQISLEIGSDGSVTRSVGHTCGSCRFAPG